MKAEKMCTLVNAPKNVQKVNILEKFEEEWSAFTSV